MVRLVSLATGTVLAAVPAATLALGPQAPFTPAPERGSAAAAAPAATTPGAALPATGLSGVRLGSAPMALIDGHWWPPGSSPRADLTLVAIRETGVGLRHRDARLEWWALHPQAQRQTPRTTPAALPTPLPAPPLANPTVAPPRPQP